MKSPELRTIVLTWMLALFAQIGFAGCLLAAEDEVEGKVVDKPVAADAADTPEKFAVVEKQIQEQMAPGGRYEFVKSGDKTKVGADMDAMAMMLQKFGSVAAMSSNDKIKLFNAQENLNGILTHSDRNRLVCEQRAPVGTSIPTKTCRTVGEIERTQNDTQKDMLYRQHTPQPVGGDSFKRNTGG